MNTCVLSAVEIWNKTRNTSPWPGPLIKEKKEKEKKKKEEKRETVADIGTDTVCC